jgi:hypothetical protein
MTEGDLATIIWQACLDAGHPISVPASRHAAAAIHPLIHLEPVDRRPNIARAVEQLGPHPLTDGHLAARLHRIADQLDAAHHQAMLDDAAA